MFTKVAFHQLRLNQLDPYMFPIPQCSKVANRDLKCTLRLLLSVFCIDGNAQPCLVCLNGHIACISTA